MQDGKDIERPEPAPPQVSLVTSPPSWSRISRWLGPLVAIGLIALAAAVLRQITREITFAEVSAAVHAVPWTPFLSSLGFAAVAMVTMALYDVLSVRLAGIRSLPTRVAAIAGFTGYAVSNAIGFHIIVGGSVRYRIYAAAGLTARQIAQIIALSLGTIWLAVGALYAVVFVAEPMAVPIFGHEPHLTRILGVAVGVALIALIIWLWPGRTAISVFGWVFPVPNGRGALAQMALGLADFGFATAALYVLIPHDLRPDFLPFALIFITAFLAGSLSHSPGGLGVLEAGVLLGLGAGNRPDAVAALIVFRLTYYLLPFAGAVVALALMEATRSFRSWRWAMRPILVTIGLGFLATAVFILVDWLWDRSH